MMSQRGKQTNAIQKLYNISRSKGNKAMKFCQFTERNIRNIFLEKSQTKLAGETIPRPFVKK